MAMAHGFLGGCDFYPKQTIVDGEQSTHNFQIQMVKHYPRPGNIHYLDLETNIKTHLKMDGWNTFSFPF